MSTFKVSLARKLAESHLFMQADLDQILEEIQTRLGEKDLSKLRYLDSGFWADVFWLTDKKKVVKITRDLEDAKASLVVQKKPSKYLVKTYDVFSVTPDLASVYCIVNEKLTPLGAYEEKIIAAIKEIHKQLRLDIYISKSNWERIKEGLETDSGKSFLEDRMRIAPEDFEAFYKNILEALTQRHIKWGDVKRVNFMMRGHQMVISDLGAGVVTGAPKVPVLHP